MTDPYDSLPYTEHAYAESHPDNLTVVARLAGWKSAALEAPRVLELGCGRGGNLLPMASAWPEATFVGVDRSEAQISRATQIASAAGLTNVKLVTGDVTQVDIPPESFDFVLCHGLYSWVDEATRRALLARIQEWLAPAGIAYVSFNTLPGWYSRLAARDWLRFATRLNRDPHRDPREELAWLASVVSKEHDAYQRDLSRVATRLRETDRAYVTHEYLSDEHHPVHVTTFLAEARDARLAYLADAIPSSTLLLLSPDAVIARGSSLDVPDREALVDLTRNTAFRRALLVRVDDATETGFRSPSGLLEDGLATLRVASRLVPHGPIGSDGFQAFVGSAGSVQASGSLAAALRLLADAAPLSVPYETLAARAGGDIGAELLDLWLAGTGVDLHAREPLLSGRISDRPVACPVARWHAVHGGPITNRWHQEVVLPEAVVRFLLGLLDGSCSAADLARRLAEDWSLDEKAATDVVTTSLALLAKSATLVR